MKGTEEAPGPITQPSPRTMSPDIALNFTMSHLVKAPSEINLLGVNKAKEVVPGLTGK